jgi:NDP-sugar pyrophosphorylase family protein
MTSYRALTIDEIVRLKAQACVAEDWSKIQVAEGFRTEAIYDVRFSGEIRMGAFDEDILEHDGFVAYAGIRHATLHNVTVGDGCLIENIGSYISNYEIGDLCYIRNVGSMMTSGRTAFGNGVTVAAIDESGCSAFPICAGLSAPVAYAMATKCGGEEVAAGLKRLVSAEASRHADHRGHVGSGAYICDTRQIVNVHIGQGCMVSGASKLVNGSLLNEGGKECVVGSDVIAQDFILSGGATLDNGAIVTRCFVGQGSHLGNRFTATDSYIASNCHFENGEACSIFAGPYTVSHHKNTLLIAGEFSFMNAGSGTNESNHLYKTGPIHHGTLERGAKTASDAYLMWPTHVGAYSLVMGRVKGHPDTSAFPFSYLIGGEEKTYLVPAANLRTVGTWRDVLKWPQRDKRVVGAERDLIRFDLLNPVVMAKVRDGLAQLREWEACKYVKDELNAGPLYVRKSRMARAIDEYTDLQQMFAAQAFVRYLKRRTFANVAEFREFLQPKTELGQGEWQDLAGFVAPLAALQPIWEAVKADQVEDLDELLLHLQDVDEHYDEYVWSWIHPTLDVQDVQDFLDLMTQWKQILRTLSATVEEGVEADLKQAGEAHPEAARHPFMREFEAMMQRIEEDADDVETCIGPLR